MLEGIGKREVWVGVLRIEEREWGRWGMRVSLRSQLKESAPAMILRGRVVGEVVDSAMVVVER